MRAEPGCPKHMVFGPCGGVRPDLGCEINQERCPFTTRALVEWPEVPAVRTESPVPRLAPSVAPQAGSLLDVCTRRPVVVTDLTVRAYDQESVRSVVGLLADTADALLVGEHQNRPDYPPTLIASLVMAAGGRPWVTLTCRDRNRVVLESELAGLAALGVDGVHCVTGDGRAHGVRPEVTQVFDLDGPRLASLAASAGLAVSVAATPAAPPARLRPGRVLVKERAGARLCFVNHVESAARLAEFVGAAREAGVTMPFIGSVAVYTDERSAGVLRGFPGLELDNARMEEVLAASDPVSAGIDAAVEEARRLLAVPGVVGVNLSGLASGEGEEAAAKVKATIGREVRDGSEVRDELVAGARGGGAAAGRAAVGDG